MRLTHLKRRKSMAEIIPFPAKEEPPEIDWEAVERERKENYPRIPKKAITVFREILESRSQPSGSYIVVEDAGSSYPPEVISVQRCKSAVMWIMDLLDRYGGTLAGAKLQCTIRRARKRLPVFVVNEITEETRDALTSALGAEFEHFIRSNAWQFIAKELPQTDLVATIISSRKEEGKNYLGLFDRKTILILMERLGEGFSIDDLIAWGQ
jgi:hypothetical protein